MWCENCNAGNEGAIFTDHCPQCRKTLATGFKATDKNPIPKKPVRSIRAMWKRVGYTAPRQDKPEVSSAESEDIAQIMKDAQSRD